MLTLAMYQPDIAQNLGTTLRSCACLGVEAAIIEPCGFPLDDRKLKRSGMDYMDQVNYQRHLSWQHFFQWIEQHHKRLILLSSKATTNYTDFAYNADDVLMVGRETAGVPCDVANACHEAVTIAMYGKARSLNVAISAAMVIGEALRQMR